MADSKSFRAKLERRKGQKEQLESTIQLTSNTISANKRTLSKVERALDIVQAVGLLTQKQLEYHLAEQVSLAMEAVFDDPYKLIVRFEEKRGRTEVQLLFSREDLEFPPLGSAGGGTIDIASFALRIAYWSMRHDIKSAPILLLDEPFSQLKGESANRKALSMVQELAHKLHLQIIMVSDERVPREDILEHSDRVYLVQKPSIRSTITPL